MYHPEVSLIGYDNILHVDTAIRNSAKIQVLRNNHAYMFAEIYFRTQSCSDGEPKNPLQVGFYYSNDAFVYICCKKGIHIGGVGNIMALLFFQYPIVSTVYIYIFYHLYSHSYILNIIRFPSGCSQSACYSYHRF